MISWTSIVALSIGLGLILTWKEWKRNNRARLWQRISVSLLAVGSLLLVAFPFKQFTDHSSSGNLILLTGGYNRDSLSRFIKKINHESPVFSTNRGLIPAAPVQNIQWIPDLSAFSEKFRNDTFHVFGNGFNKDELAQLNDHPLVFHPNEALPAVSHISWKRQLVPGEPLVVQGHYENGSAHEIRVFLIAFNEPVDSALVPSRSQLDFTLRTVPRNRDRAVFSLVTVSVADTLENEPIPFVINTEERPKILFLSSSPGAENTFLKNLLSRQGYAITARTAISKNKTDQQFLNMPEQAGDLLTASNLANYDILVADEDMLRSLPPARITAIRAALEEQGLGMIVRMDEENKKAFFYSGYFPLIPLKKNLAPASTFRISVRDSTYRCHLNPDGVPRIGYQAGTRMLVQDEQAAVFAAATIYGNGKIVATTLQNSFSLALSGQSAAYQALWSLLLENAVKKSVPAEEWRFTPVFPFPDEPVLMESVTAEEWIPQGQAGNSRIDLKQDSLLPWQWQGMYWPVVPGWQPVKPAGGKSYDWYVYKKGDWARLLDLQKLKATNSYTLHHPVSPVQQTGSPATNRSGLFRLFLLILFFACLAFLWIEQKSS